jgi:hypothetical protein
VQHIALVPYRYDFEQVERFADEVRPLIDGSRVTSPERP